MSKSNRSHNQPSPPAAPPSVAQTVRRTFSRWSQRAANLFTVSRGDTFFEAAAESPQTVQVADVGPNARNAERHSRLTGDFQVGEWSAAREW